MKNTYFTVRYFLESLEIKSNPLFTRVKAYLVSQGIKRIIAEGKYIENDKIVFQATVEEENKALVFNNHTETYQQCINIISLQFQAEGRFIKMGQASINIANMANCQQNGQLLSYRVQKCFERNAKIWLSVTLFVENATKRISSEIYDQQSQNSKSYNYLPNRTKKLSEQRINQPNRIQFSAVYNCSLHQKNSFVSQPKKKYPPKSDRPEKQQTPKIEMLNLYHGSQQIEHLNLQLNERVTVISTDLRLAQQELAALEAKYCQLISVNEAAQQELSSALAENYRLAGYCSELQSKVSALQKNFDSQRQSSNSEIQKYLRLYQESEQTRNKLLVDLQVIKNEETEKLRISEARVAEEQQKIKKLQKDEAELKNKIENCEAQIQSLRKSLQRQKALRLKQKQEITELAQALQKLNNDREKALQEAKAVKNKNTDLINELELVRFSLAEIEKELTEQKFKEEQRQQLIVKYQRQLDLTKEVIKKQNNRYSQEIQRMENETQEEHKNLQVYIEELESKTIQEYSRVNQLSEVKKQMASLKKMVLEEEDKNKELHTQNGSLKAELQKTQAQLKEEQKRTLLLTKQKTILEIQLKTLQEEQTEMIAKDNCMADFFAEEDKNALMEQCFTARDQFWRSQVDKIQSDTLILIQKNKKQKEFFNKKIEELENQLSNAEEETSSLRQKLKNYQQETAVHNKKIASSQSRIKFLQQTGQELSQSLASKQSTIQSLSKKIQQFGRIQTVLVQTQKKLQIKNKELEGVRSDFQREKAMRLKQRQQLKQIIISIANIMAKPQKSKIFYQELRTQIIEPEIVIMLNSTLKMYCDKHNKNRQRIETIQTMKEQIETKEKEVQKIAKSLELQKEASQSSKSSNKADFFNEELVFLQKSKLNRLAAKQEPNASVFIWKQENQDLKQKWQKQLAKTKQLQDQNLRQQKIIETYQFDIKKIAEETEAKTEEFQQLKITLRSKDNQINNLKEELKETTNELSQAKKGLEESARLLQQQKNKSVFKKGPSVTYAATIKPNDTLVKIADLQKKLKITQQQLDRSRRQKQDRKKDEAPLLKQIKQLELKIKQKQAIISEVKKQAETQKSKHEQDRDLLVLREKKRKEEYEDQLEIHKKNQKELQEKIVELEEKSKHTQKKVKDLEDSIKANNAQTTAALEKQEKTKRMSLNEWELKVKSLQFEHKNELAILQRMIDEQKSVERSLRDKIQQKQLEILDLSNQLEKKELKIEDLKAELEVYGVKLKNLQEDEVQYKQTIQVLENKVKNDSNKGSRKTIEKQGENYDSKSDYSLGTFTFR